MSDFNQLNKKSTQKRIDSPMAKYSSNGLLSCVVCNQVIKSELVWTAHLNSKTHSENKKRIKMELIGEMAKPLSIDPKNQPKQDTSINKLSEASSKRIMADETGNDAKKQKIDKIVQSTNSIDLNAVNAKYNSESSQIVTERSIKSMAEKNVDLEQEKKNEEVGLPVAGASLPEGFFDDPELDAKVRGKSRSENLETEYEEFKKIIQNEEVKSDVLIEKDDLISNVDRDIEEVDDLIYRWKKIESLHLRRENLIKTVKEKESEKVEVYSSDDEEIDLDNVLNFNLRSKNLF